MSADRALARRIRKALARGQMAQAADMAGPLLGDTKVGAEARMAGAEAFLAVGRPDIALRLTVPLAADPAAAPARLRVHAQAQMGLSRAREAAATLDRIVAQAPTAADWSALMAARRRLGELEAAMAAGEAAIAAGATDGAIRANMAGIMATLAQDRGRDELAAPALAHMDAAIAALGPSPELTRNRGVVLKALGRWDDAAAAFETVLADTPNDVDALVNLSSLRWEAGEVETGLALAAAAAAAGPTDARAQRTHGHMALAVGDLATGWSRYRARRYVNLADGRMTGRGFRQAEWQGQDLTGASLLHWAEQGIGEEIMALSAVPDLLAQAARLVIEVDPRLTTLAARSFPAATVVSRETPPHPAAADAALTYQVSAMDALGHCRPDCDSFPPPRPYLVPDPARVAEVRSWLAGLGPGPKIGISWSSANRRKRGKSLPPALAAVAMQAVPDAVWIDVQYGAVADERAALAAAGAELMRHPDIDPTGDQDAFAALLAGLDRVVTISNATAHLAGAIGQKTDVLLDAMPFWHWFRDRVDSPWYPEVRLYRQETPGDWAPVLAALKRVQ